jgi:hypothetical protein
MSSADGFRVSILAAGSCQARGKTSNRISPDIRPRTLSMFKPTRKWVQYPVKNFPIPAKLLVEYYQPVARTAEGMIYRMR